MEKLFKQLSDVQATLFTLFHKTWVYHWGVTGPDFYQLHSIFGEQYEEMFKEIDRLSEHMRYLGMKPVSTLSRITEVSVIEQATDSSQNLTAKIMVKQLLQDNQTLIDFTLDTHNTASRLESLGTTNILEDILESHGKYVWMLRSMAESTRGSSPVEDVADMAPEEPVQEETEQELPETE